MFWLFFFFLFFFLLGLSSGWCFYAWENLRYSGLNLGSPSITFEVLFNYQAVGVQQTFVRQHKKIPFCWIELFLDVDLGEVCFIEYFKKLKSVGSFHNRTDWRVRTNFWTCNRSTSGQIWQFMEDFFVAIQVCSANLMLDLFFSSTDLKDVQSSVCTCNAQSPTQYLILCMRTYLCPLVVIWVLIFSDKFFWSWIAGSNKTMTMGGKALLCAS